MRWAWVFVGAMAALFVLGCSGAAQVVAYAATNQAAVALGWVDATLTAEFEAQSDAKLDELGRAGATLQDYDAWVTASGWELRRQRIALAYDAHALLVSHLEGETEADRETLQQAITVIADALRLSVSEIESSGGRVPQTVKTAADAMQKLTEEVR